MDQWGPTIGQLLQISKLSKPGACQQIGGYSIAHMYSVFTSPKVFGILLSLVLINVQNLSFMIYEILFLVESNILQ